MDASELPIAERTAARLDGELYVIDGRFVPVDVPPYPELCAERMVAELPRNAFAERRSAAWLHGALGEPPRRAQFAFPARTGARPRRVHGFTLRQVAITAAELTTIGGCPVTTPLRTLVDLLLDHEQHDEAALAAVRAVAAAAALSPGDAGRALSARYRLPHTLVAERRLERWAALSRR